MHKRTFWALVLAGAGAGVVAGIFGAGGGMVLVPLLTLTGALEDREVFSGSLAVIFPICVTVLVVCGLRRPLAWREALPYLPGSALGGYLAGKWSRHIPTTWLHRGLGVLILWGGIRYLC